MAILTVDQIRNTALVILSTLENETGVAPHLVEWCNFVMEFNDENDYRVDGMFDRVFKCSMSPSMKRRAAYRNFESNIQFGLNIISGIRYTPPVNVFSMLSREHIARKCPVCDEYYVLSHNSIGVCDTCMSERTTTCRFCGTRITTDEKMEGYVRPAKFRKVHEREALVCYQCSLDEFVACAVCKNPHVFIRDTVYGLDKDTGDYLRYCMSCKADGAVKLCTTCNNYVPSGKMVGNLCVDCHVKKISTKKRADIHSHNFKFSPLIFLSTSPTIPIPYGLEIEVDHGNKSASLMEYIEELKNIIKLKSDGSLDDGFEIVTTPMTLDVHKTVVPYAELFRRLTDDGYTSHENSTCGLHIHIGRTGFGATARSQNPAIARLIYLFELFKPQLKTFSRRREFRYCQFYDLSTSLTPKLMRQSATYDNRMSRYRAVNLQNPGTVEIRIFKGSLKTTTVLAAIELCDYMVKYVVKNKDDSKYNTTDLTWNGFTSGIPRRGDYPNLIDYMRRKALI